MVDDARKILLLADRVTGRDRADTIIALVAGLRAREIAPTLICTEAAEIVREAMRVVEWPGLTRRWGLAWSLRDLRIDGQPPRAALLHVLDATVMDAGIEIAERWAFPYVLSIEEFPPVGSRVRMSRRWVRAVVATSRELADDLTRGLGIPPDVLRIIPRGLSPFDLAPARRPPGGVTVVGTAGPLVVGSGFSTFLNAARRVLDAGVDAEFVLVGEGEEEGDLRRRAERLKLVDRLTFVDERATLLSIWDVLEVYCQPSLIPTVGRNLARSLAHGLPAVASDIEGLRTLVDDGETGLRVPPGDSESLTRAILRLLTDPEAARRLGQAGRTRIARDLDIERECESLARLYHEIIDEETAKDGSEEPA